MYVYTYIHEYIHGLKTKMEPRTDVLLQLEERKYSYIYTYIYIRTHIYVYIHIYIYIYIYIYMYVCACIYICIYMYMYSMHTYVHMCINVFIIHAYKCEKRRSNCDVAAARGQQVFIFTHVLVCTYIPVLNIYDIMMNA